jgi:hypothetical protein
MREYWSNSDVVAWTDHDGPHRPSSGLPDAWYRGLAGGFGAWFVLAVIGCEVVHHSGGDHVPVSTAETIGAMAVFLGLPAMIVLLSKREVAGAWLAALLGALACAISLTQWSLAPAYTLVEAGGFAALGLLGLGLVVAHRPSRQTPVTLADDASTPIEPAVERSSAGQHTAVR